MSYMMGLSEFAIRKAIKILADEGKPITPDAVARTCDCHKNTVYKVFKYLRTTEELQREGTPRSGYKYTYRGSAKT